MRIGDRYKYVERGTHIDTLEVIEIHHTNLTHFVCVESLKGEWRVGDETDWDVEYDVGWEYIGNFNKSENFNNLYDKLSA